MSDARARISSDAPVSSSDSSVAAPPQDEYFESHGIHIHFVQQGTGEPIVLIHGHSGNIEKNWKKWDVFQKLSQNHRVIALDCRGHGKSGKPHGEEHYGRKMADDVIRLLEHLPLRKAHIVSYSMGGNIVAWLLTRKPELFLTAVLGGAPTCWHDHERAEREAAEIEQGMMRSRILRFWPKDKDLPTEEEIRRISEEWIEGEDRRALADCLRAIKDLAVTPAQMAAITVPVLAIAGTADTHFEEMCSLEKTMRPRLRLVPIEGATHLGTSGAPSRPEFIEAISQFIEANHAN